MVECFLLGFIGSLSAWRSAGRSGIDSVLCLFAGRSERFGVVEVEVEVEVELELSRLLYVLTTRLLDVKTPPMLILRAGSASTGLHLLGLCLASSCGFLLYRR